MTKPKATTATKTTTPRAPRAAKVLNAGAKADGTKAVTPSNFQKQVLARITGDTNETNAANIERLAVASIKAQLSVLEGSVVEKELLVAEAEKAEYEARFPTSIDIVRDSQGFVNGLVKAAKATKDAKKVLEKTHEYISTLKGVLEDYA